MPQQTYLGCAGGLKTGVIELLDVVDENDHVIGCMSRGYGIPRRPAICAPARPMRDVLIENYAKNSVYATKYLSHGSRLTSLRGYRLGVRTRLSLRR